MDNTPRYAVTYGRTDYFAEEGLRTIFVTHSDEVKQLASQFIQVIPDDLDSYKQDIKDWDGSSTLVITHQDDDTFLFSVTPIQKTVEGIAAFQDFVSTFMVPDDEEDEDSEEEDDEDD